MIEEGLRTRLLAVAGVTALVSTRVYPVVMPQGATFPLITYQQIGGRRQNTFGGPTHLVGALFRVDCWGGPAGETSQGYSAARALASAVRSALDGWSGVSSGATVQISIMESDPVDIYEEETGVHRTVCEFRIWWQEAA